MAVTFKYVPGVYSIPPFHLEDSRSIRRIPENDVKRTLSALEYLNGTSVTLDDGRVVSVEFSESSDSTERLPLVYTTVYDLNGDVVSSGNMTVSDINELLQQIPNVPATISRHFERVYDAYKSVEPVAPKTGLHLVVLRANEEETIDLIYSLIDADNRTVKINGDYTVRLTPEIADACIERNGLFVYLIDGTFEDPKTLLYSGFIQVCMDNDKCVCVVKGNGYREYENPFMSLIVQMLYVHGIVNRNCATFCQYKSSKSTETLTIDTRDDGEEFEIEPEVPYEYYSLPAVDYFDEDDPKFDIINDIALELMNDDESYFDTALEQNYDKYAKIFYQVHGVYPDDIFDMMGMGDDEIMNVVDEDAYKAALRDVTVGDVMEELASTDVGVNKLIDNFDSEYGFGYSFGGFGKHGSSDIVKWDDKSLVPNVTKYDYQRSIDKYGEINKIIDL